jgi:nucleotide-binding universal stress UspA family protein
MFKKILVPLDGSEISEKALLYGRVLAKYLGSEIILFHSCIPEHKQYRHMHQLYLDRMSELLVEQSKSIDGIEIKVNTFIETGEPYENICNIVQENDIGLILMTSVGSSNVKATAMGTIAERICRTVPVPVMLIKPSFFLQNGNKDIAIKNIFIPMDGSNLSKLSLPWAEGLAQQLPAKITLFQMAQLIRPNITSDAIEGIDYTRLSEVEERRVNSEMAVLADEIKQKGINVTTMVTVGYDGASEIIEACKKTSADLLIMSTHGRSGLGRWVYGSVAGKVMHQIEIPLLLINARTG